MNDFYLLRSKEKLFVAQVWRPNTKNKYDLNRQMEFLTYLNKSGIRVPIPQKNITNEWVFSFKGMDGKRSSLILEAIRLIKECKPDFFIWENVKGTFSSNSGEDFAGILQAFTNIGGYRLEWQLLNYSCSHVSHGRQHFALRL